MNASRFVEEMQLELRKRLTPEVSVETGLTITDIEDFKRGSNLTTEKVLVIMDYLGYIVADKFGKRVRVAEEGPIYE